MRKDCQKPVAMLLHVEEKGILLVVALVLRLEGALAADGRGGGSSRDCGVGGVNAVVLL